MSFEPTYDECITMDCPGYILGDGKSMISRCLIDEREMEAPHYCPHGWHHVCPTCGAEIALDVDWEDQIVFEGKTFDHYVCPMCHDTISVEVRDVDKS